MRNAILLGVLGYVAFYTGYNSHLENPTTTKQNSLTDVTEFSQALRELNLKILDRCISYGYTIRDVPMRMPREMSLDVRRKPRITLVDRAENIDNFLPRCERYLQSMLD